MPPNKPRFERTAKTVSPKLSRHFWFMLIFFVLLSGFVGSGLYLYFMTHRTAKGTAKYDIIARSLLSYALVDVPQKTQSDITTILKRYAETQQQDLVTQPSEQADIVITTKPQADDIVLSTATTPRLSPITSGKPLDTQHFVIGLRVRSKAQIPQIDQLTQAFAPTYQPQPKTWTYLAIGDIIPARDVYTYSKRYGYIFPYQRIIDTLKQPDLTVTNVETTLADGQANGEGAGMMVFTAPAKSITGLVEAGIDGVSLANNHAMNGGPTKVAEMLKNLQASHIGHFGVSTTSDINTWTTTIQGYKITHLSFNSIPGSIEPTASTPGARRIAIKPWGALSNSDIAYVQAQIKAAKAQADIVIPWFHWGTEYTHDANDEQRQLAHAAIDAGAAAVIGTHPHWTQGIEWYNGHFIAYSLGNFIFDQNWSDETRRSVAAQLTFTGTTVTGVELKPVYIENWVQPRFLTPSEALYKQILSDVAAHSWWQ